MNFVFMGTSEFAVPALRALIAENMHGSKNDFTVKLVLTRPDAASGRGKALIPSPVRICAEEASIPVITLRSFYVTSREASTKDSSRYSSFNRLTGESIADNSPDLLDSTVKRLNDRQIADCRFSSDSDIASASYHNSETLSVTQSQRAVNTELLSRIAATEPDFIVVASFGIILPQQVLELPRFGCINIHGSLLPRWRGAAPIQRAILAGDTFSGVSIMRMESGLDTGAVCCEAKVSVAGKSTRELANELATLGAKLLVGALPRIADGSVEWREQAEEGLCYADKINKSELALDPDVSASLNIRRVLASTPQAPARCLIGKRSVTILDAVPVDAPAVESVAPTSAERLQKGTALYLDNKLILSTVDGGFEVTSLKPDGKKAMDAAAFVAGFRELQKGDTASVTWGAIERDPQ